MQRGGVIQCGVIQCVEDRILLPESGMTSFRDAGRFVGQSGTAGLGSGDAGKLTVVKTEGLSKEC